jgi:GntR family transcriptional regulator
VIDEGKPLFLQTAEQIENDILAGSIAEEGQVPSTNECAAFTASTQPPPARE